MEVNRIQSQKSYSPVKKAAKTVAAAAAVTVATGAVLYQASKTGKLNPAEGNKVIEGIKAALKKPADALVKKVDPMIASANEKIAASAIKSKITHSKVYKTVQPKVQKAASTVAEKVGGLKSRIQDLHIADKISSKFEAIKDFVKSKGKH